MTRNNVSVSVQTMAVPAALLVTVGIVYANLAAYPAMVRSGEAIELAVAKHIAIASIGVAAMFGLSRTTFDRLKRLSPILLVVCILALGLVWMPGIGHTANGSSRWIGWGLLKLQPSEFAKLTLILYIAALVSDPHYGVNTIQGLIVPLFATAFVCGLIMAEPDLGTAIVVFLGVVHLLYVAGARPKHLAWVLAGAGVLAVVMTMSAGHRRHRVFAWLAPGDYRETSGYQIVESLIAVGENGIGGKGFAHGEAPHFVPAADTDYIMATVAEETGLGGVIVVLGLMGVIVWQAHRVARGTHDRFAGLASTGAAALLIWQTLINVAVVTNSIPSTGVPMPFISAGGSSLLASLAAVGIIARPRAGASETGTSRSSATVGGGRSAATRASKRVALPWL